MKHTLIAIVFLLPLFGNGQELDSLQLNFREYLGYVKKYHPVVKQANLVLDMGEATLLRARGAFDPKLEVDYDRKEFKGTDYFEKLNATFKIPTWYGIELKGNLEQNEGAFLNPEATVPEDGLYSAGVSLSLAQGLFINERMATLKRAKLFEQQSQADREILVNNVLFDASLAYFNWWEAYQQLQIFRDFVENARIRFEGVKRSAEVGEVAAIDSTEAKIAYQSRLLGLEQSSLEYAKASLELSNFLWLAENTPVVVSEAVSPEPEPALAIDSALQVNGIVLSDFNLENHPKLRSLNLKVAQLEVDRRLKANKLLPRIDAEYNFITPDPDLARSFTSENYKAGVQVSFPLFLRKERGDLALAKAKLNDSRFELQNETVSLQNKITAVFQELDSYNEQVLLIDTMVENYQALLSAEDRKFSFGESSLFLVNTRESQLIDAQLKQAELINKWFTSKAKLFRTLVLDTPEL
jgi:outer membrane protein TolC